MSYSLEAVYKIWNDKTGDRLEVTPDSDALGLVEIRSVTEDGEMTARIVADKEQVKLLIQALSETLDQLEN